MSPVSFLCAWLIDQLHSFMIIELKKKIDLYDYTLVVVLKNVKITLLAFNPIMDLLTIKVFSTLTSPLALASSTMLRNRSIWARLGGVKSTMLMWCRMRAGQISYFGGIDSNKHTRCLMPFSTRNLKCWGSEGQASPASFWGWIHEKFGGVAEARDMSRWSSAAVTNALWFFTPAL